MQADLTSKQLAQTWQDGKSRGICEEGEGKSFIQLASRRCDAKAQEPGAIQSLGVLTSSDANSNEESAAEGQEVDYASATGVAALASLRCLACSTSNGGGV